MARTRRPIGEELDPESPRGRLYADVTGAYPRSLNVFFVAVAKAAGTTSASEKGTFYRYLRGGTLPPDRLQTYAGVLGRTADAWLETGPPPIRRDEVLERLESLATSMERNQSDLLNLVEALAQQRGLAATVAESIQDAIGEIDRHLDDLATARAVAEIERRLGELDAFVRDALRRPRSGDGRGRRAG